MQPDPSASNSSYRAIGHLFNPRATVLHAADTKYSLTKTASGVRTLLCVPLYYSALEAGSAVEVQWMESILADDGRSVDAARLAEKGIVGKTSLRLNDKAELMLPFPAAGIRPHSFLFFFVSKSEDVAALKHA